jgi:hypothetical protein
VHPNLFLIGAPKCGTTALHDYLAQHPDVFMSEPKEPHHFCTDLDAPFAVRERSAYEALFENASGKIAGESSATYLYSRVAAQKISERYPEAKLIAMLRNPLEMLPSLHSQKRVNGTEPCATFAEALEAEKKRKAGELEARGAFPYYYDAALYSEQLTRYLGAFPADQLHIIVFDDFKRDVAGVYAGVLHFLGLRPFTPDFKIVNRNKRIRSRALHNVLQNPRSPVHRLPKPLGTLTYKALDKLNSAVETRVPLEESVADQLKRDFTPEVERLSNLLGRDLRHWVA